MSSPLEPGRLRSAGAVAPSAQARFPGRRRAARNGGKTARSLDALLPPWQDAAAAILRGGLWCGIEVCVSVAAQAWEPRLVILRDSVAGVADAVTDWIEDFPRYDARISGYSRAGLRRIDGAPTALCHIGSAMPFWQVDE